ncbi:MAG TPA: hypothetical protein PKX75_22195, partial [Nitrospira sp.]|nr:hypothetical protein [Nitrospira sp.]
EVTVEQREGQGAWQTATLDAAGRLKLIPRQPGLIELKITATDRDGFTGTHLHTIRVKDPADTGAPQLAWTGILAGASGQSEPRTLVERTPLAAQLSEAQLMRWHLQIAAAGSQTWQTLAQADTPASSVAQTVALADLDPRQLANGAWQLRLSAWDLAGRSSELSAKLIVDTADKTFTVRSETDATVTLAGHPLALARQWTAGAGEGAATGAGQGKRGDFGNWTLPLLATRLTSDQPATLDNGSLAPWTDGARVWISLPADLADAQAGTLHLAFTLTTPSERLASEPGAPQIWHPVFANAQGWTLQAHGRSEADSPDRLQSTDRPDSLIRLGERLYDQVTGLPWQPAAYTLIAPASASPAGTRYSLDGQGRIQAIRFADGQAWRVSDAGIAAVGSNAGERIDLQRDSAGRIARITLPEASAANSDGRTAIAYRYDSEGRLILVR